LHLRIVLSPCVGWRLFPEHSNEALLENNHMSSGTATGSAA
jgi:hypothetical protein